MAYFDVNKIIVRFKIKYPRFEYIIDELPIEYDDSIETACTDGEKLYFNKQFMESLDEDEQLFTFAHEVLHVALNHIDRCLDKNMYYWNLATDAVINDYLRNNGLKFVKGCVDIEGALNHSAEEMYEKLLKEEEEQKEDEPKEIKDSDKRGNGKPMKSPSSGNNENPDNDKDGDENKSPSDSKEDRDKENENDNRKSTNDKEKTEEERKKEKRDNNVGHDDHSKWEETAKKHKEEGTLNSNKPNEKNEFKENADEKKKKDDDYLKNGLNGTKRKGSEYTEGSKRGRVEGIEGLNESPISWQDLLKMNYRSNPDWRTTEEVENGVLIEDLEDDESCECEILIDTSGSVSIELIRNFLTECLTIAKNNKIKVGFFDTKFYGFHDIRDEDDIAELTIEGGGGTDFNSAVEAFTDSCQNKIIFTDGCAEMPEKEVDATWIVFGYYKHEIHPKGGNTIYINGDEYDTLREKQRTR